MISTSGVSGGLRPASSASTVSMRGSPQACGDVVAGAERAARARDDDGAHVGARVGVAQDALDLVVHVERHGVARRRAVERDRRDQIASTS